MNKKLISLISLIDDANPRVAGAAMAELLTYEKELKQIIPEIQETDNKLLRKRVHQLQNILTIRRRRSKIAALINNPGTDLFDGIMELHFLWYDNDSESNIKKHLDRILQKAAEFEPSSIERLALFMRKTGFSVAPKGDIEADYYCIGIVLEEYIGADFILCALAAKIAKTWGLDLKILRLIGDFALIDSRGKILFPRNDWRLLPKLKSSVNKLWDSQTLLKMTASMLFLCAASTDSFRYISTIGNCLARVSGENDLRFLPYPYNKETGEKDHAGS